jgi:hypothetical protein
VKPRLKIEGVVFTSCIVMVMAGAVFIAKDWPLRASIGILVLGSIGAILASIQLFFDLGSESPERRKSALDLPQQENASKWANAEIWAWIIGFYCAIVLVGFLLAVPLFVLLYNKTYGGSWPVATGLSALSWVFVYGIFEKILHVPWPSPLVPSLF